MRWYSETRSRFDPHACGTAQVLFHCGFEGFSESSSDDEFVVLFSGGRCVSDDEQLVRLSGCRCVVPNPQPKTGYSGCKRSVLRAPEQIR